MTIIIYLIGRPGVGKYTIAKSIAQNSNFIICDNQLINNPIFELLQYDGYAEIPEFAWDTISVIRKEIFNFLSKMHRFNYVLTNCLADKIEDRDIYEQVKSMSEIRNSLFVPVLIQISKEEHLQRLIRPERKKRWKSISSEHANDTEPLISISHPNLLELDVTSLTPQEAAKSIANHIDQLRTLSD